LPLVRLVTRVRVFILAGLTVDIAGVRGSVVAGTGPAGLRLGILDTDDDDDDDDAACSLCLRLLS